MRGSGSGAGFGRNQDRTRGLVRSGEVERCEGRATVLTLLRFVTEGGLGKSKPARGVKEQSLPYLAA